MRKQVYISADYSESNGDRDVVDVINAWGHDNLRIVDFVDMSQVVSGSVSKTPDCRPCDLKAEFNRQINKSSAVIFVVGDKTSSRSAGSSCIREINSSFFIKCTPYKQNTNGVKNCKIVNLPPTNQNGDVSNINSKSYLQHEFEQAKKKGKTIIIVYNSSRKELNWLPSYMKGYESVAIPFWIVKATGKKEGNYLEIKKALGYV